MNYLIDNIYLEPPDNIPIMYDFEDMEIYEGEDYFSISNDIILPENIKKYLSIYYNLELDLLINIIEDSNVDIEEWLTNIGAKKHIATNYKKRRF